MPARSALFLSCPGCLVLCSLVSSTAFAWGPRIHKELAGTYYTGSLLSSFADEFGTDVSAVVNGADDLDFAGDPHHEIYHRGQWLMVLNR